MKTVTRCLVIGLANLCYSLPTTNAQQKQTGSRNPQFTIKKDYPVRPVPFTAVHFNDAFSAPRIEINRAVSIPFAFEKCEETGRVNMQFKAVATSGLRLEVAAQTNWGAGLPEWKVK